MQKRANLKRRAVLVATIAMAALTAVPAIHSVAQALRPTANVRDYGAVGNGRTNDSAAIQRANDAVARAGGGVVFFPAGTYIAANVRQDSNVEFTGNGDATLKHPDGVSNVHIVRGRVFTKKASIVEGSNLLWVSDTKGVLPGAVVGIRGAGGASPVQTATLSISVTQQASTLQAAQGSEWGKNINYLLVENEIVAYNGVSNGIFLNVKRGLFGTRAAIHLRGARVSQLSVLYARVDSVGNGWIRLDRVATQGVQGSEARVGSINMAVRGLVMDGSRAPGGSKNNPLPLKYELARWLTIEGNTIRNGDHGAVSLDMGTSDSVIANNVLFDTGAPDERMGSAVWLFRGATGVTVRDNEIGGVSRDGITIDDRTTASSEWDALSEGNLVQANRIDIPVLPGNAGIFVAGSNRNEVADNDVSSMFRGIAVVISTQGLVPGDSEGNLVHDNRVSGHSWAIHVTGSYNVFERNEITAAMRPIVDNGFGNRFFENWVQ